MLWVTVKLNCSNSALCNKNDGANSDVNEDSKVMDLATGSMGFLISSMELMIDLVETKHGKTQVWQMKKLTTSRKTNLGVELNAEMFTLASTNMILRGDGSSNIKKGSSFDEPPELHVNCFKPSIQF